jgi:hypothetical protein
MSDAKGASGANEDWYLYLPERDVPLQPYRSAPTSWPISAKELEQIEERATKSSPSALNAHGSAFVRL